MSPAVGAPAAKAEREAAGLEPACRSEAELKDPRRVRLCTELLKTWSSCNGQLVNRLAPARTGSHEARRRAHGHHGRVAQRAYLGGSDGAPIRNRCAGLRAGLPCWPRAGLPVRVELDVEHRALACVGSLDGLPVTSKVTSALSLPAEHRHTQERQGHDRAQPLEEAGEHARHHSVRRAQSDHPEEPRRVLGYVGDGCDGCGVS